MYAHVIREEWLFRGLATAMCLAMVGLAVLPAVSVGDVVWYVTNSDVMGAAALGGSAAIIAAGIQSSELAGLARGWRCWCCYSNWSLNFIYFIYYFYN